MSFFSTAYRGFLFVLLSVAAQADKAYVVSEFISKQQGHLNQMKVDISKQLGGVDIPWMPSSPGDIRDYFRYHKDFEVRLLMEHLNVKLDLGVSVEDIRARSSQHDLPKILELNELSDLGYRGWERKQAIDFLSTILDLSKSELSRQLPKEKFLKVDLATRLFFAFGLSRQNYAVLFSSPQQKKIIQRELKSLPVEINRLEELSKHRNNIQLLKKNSSLTQQKLNLLENLADWVARTENPMARIEYGKYFDKTSSILKLELKHQTDDTNRFIMEKLLAEVGEPYLNEIGLSKLIEVLESTEASYFPIISKARDKSFSDRVWSERLENQGAQRVDFLKVIDSMLSDVKGNLCKDKF